MVDNFAAALKDEETWKPDRTWRPPWLQNNPEQKLQDKTNVSRKKDFVHVEKSESKKRKLVKEVSEEEKEETEDEESNKKEESEDEESEDEESKQEESEYEEQDAKALKKSKKKHKTDKTDSDSDDDISLRQLGNNNACGFRKEYQLDSSCDKAKLMYDGQLIMKINNYKRMGRTKPTAQELTQGFMDEDRCLKVCFLFSLLKKKTRFLTLLCMSTNKIFCVFSFTTQRTIKQSVFIPSAGIPLPKKRILPNPSGWILRWRITVFMHVHIYAHTCTFFSARTYLCTQHEWK